MVFLEPYLPQIFCAINKKFRRAGHSAKIPFAENLKKRYGYFGNSSESIFIFFCFSSMDGCT